MKTSTGKIICLVLILAILMTCSVLLLQNVDKTYALDERYPAPIGGDNVYYFSDSTPSRKTVMDSLGIYVFYDVHSYISPQEFAFLVYSGYFWGFDNTDYYTTVAIIEIKTFMPDESVLVALFQCLQAQNVRVMFINPHIDEYSLDVQAMSCSLDMYDLFLKSSFESMMGEGDSIQDGTTLLIDGRFIGFYPQTDDYGLESACFNSRVLRRIMYYLSSEFDASFFELGLYEEIWEYYSNTFYEEAGIEDLNFGATMDEYLEAWRKIEDKQISVSDEAMEEYMYNFKRVVGKYYRVLADILKEKNIHILVYVDGNKYIELFGSPDEEFNYGEYAEYVFDDYGDVFDAFPDTQFIAAMMIDPCYTDFYDLLYNIYFNLPQIREQYNLKIEELFVFVWFEGEINLGSGGLPVKIAVNSKSLTDEDAEEMLDEEFIQKLYELFE